MSKATTLPTKRFIVLVDTNPIWTDENSLSLLSKSFLDKWSNLSKLGDVTLIIPEVVLLELAYRKLNQFRKDYQDARGKLNKIETDLKLGIKIPEEYGKEKFRSEIEKLLREQLKQIPYCSSYKHPIEKIKSNLESIIENAIWRNPPFRDDRGGEGFRDSIILETAKLYQESLTHDHIILLTKDAPLKGAAFESFKDVSNFIILENITELENYLTAARKQFSPDFLNQIITKAAQIFCDNNYNPSKGFFIDANIREVLIKKYDLKIDNLGIDNNTSLSGILGMFSSTYYVASEPNIYITETKFLSIIGDNTFHWSTGILLAANYKSGGTIMTGPGKIVKERIIKSHIEWEATVTDKGDFTKIKLLNITTENSIYVDIPEPKQNLSGIGDSISLADALLGKKSS